MKKKFLISYILLLLTSCSKINNLIVKKSCNNSTEGFHFFGVFNIDFEKYRTERNVSKRIFYSISCDKSTKKCEVLYFPFSLPLNYETIVARYDAVYQAEPNNKFVISWTKALTFTFLPRKNKVYYSAVGEQVLGKGQFSCE